MSNPQADISIRFVRESDVAAFRSLRLEALRMHPNAFGSDFDEDSQHPESVWIERIQKVANDPDGTIVFADVGNELAGMVGIWRNKGVKSRHAAGLWGVYVRPQYRGQDLGQRMIDHALDWCRSRQIRIVRLMVSTRNDPAIHCYERAGFARAGISPEEIRIGDTYYDELIMWRRP